MNPVYLDETLRELADSVRTQTAAMTDTMGAMTRALDRMAVQLADVDRRLITLEAARTDHDITRLEGAISRLDQSIDELIAWRNRFDGGLKLFDWVRNSWPFIAAIGVGITAYVLSKVPK